jgi:hypothetical protein
MLELHCHLTAATILDCESRCDTLVAGHPRLLNTLDLNLCLGSNATGYIYKEPLGHFGDNCTQVSSPEKGSLWCWNCNYKDGQGNQSQCPHIGESKPILRWWTHNPGCGARF